MTNYAAIVFPVTAPVGVANRQPIPQSPSVAISVKASIAPTVPATAVGNFASPPTTTQAVGTRAQPVNPYNNTAPAVAVPNRVPFPTPLGVSPQFETPTENWTYDYGDSPGI